MSVNFPQEDCFVAKKTGLFLTIFKAGSKGMVVGLTKHWLEVPASSA